MLLRGLIPAGFMPDLAAAGGGSLQLVICIGGGLKVVTVPATLADVEHETPTSTSDYCAFGGLTVPVLLPVGQSALWSLLAQERGYDVRTALRHDGKADVPALGARAPPCIA
ncbi:MAG: hypothetical protein ABL904_25630 [Hyphomicrobiaceae bacterium]